MKEKIKALIKEAKLKYNYFSSEHPNPKLRGKLFKFLDDNKIQFLKTKEIYTVSKPDLEHMGKKLYSPADMS